jgi:hypothetical protein
MPMSKLMNIILAKWVIWHHIDVVTWLCSINKYGYINVKFSDLSTEVKNILIYYNMVDPDTLDLADLQYYLSRTNNVVPKGFKNKHNLKVSESGTRTKPAPHN